MLLIIPSEFFSAFLIVMFVVTVMLISGAIIQITAKTRKTKFPKNKHTIVFSLLSVFIVAISWIFNFGWIRLIMTFLFIPIIHAIVFFVTNIFASKHADNSLVIKKYNLFFIVTYLAAYVFLPDGGDTDGPYFFFGLVHNEFLSYIVAYISHAAFLANIVLFVLLIVEMKKLETK